MSTHAGAKWSLDQAAFETLLCRLAPDGDTAAAEYEAIRRRLIAFFEGRRSTWPEAHADETIDRVARKLEQGARVDNVRGYFYGVARRVLQEQYRHAVRERAALDTLRRTIVPSGHGAALERRITRLEQCVENLPEENRLLIVGYYEDAGLSHGEERRRLAARLGITYVTLKTRAMRIRSALQASLRHPSSCRGHHFHGEP